MTLSGSRIDGGGVMMSITDSGIGMTAEELAQANERLSETAAVDVSVSRRMGLFVVSRLAHRHGIRVQLRTQTGGGLTAMVLLPESLLGSAPAPAYEGSAGAMAGMQRDAFTPPAAPPQWGDNGFRMSPAHPSYPGASPEPSWPSGSRWPSGGSDDSWTSEPRGGGFDTDDVWIPSRVPNSWTSEPSEPPARSSEPLPTRNPANRKPSFDYPETVENGATGPIPTVNPSSAGDDYLPIFASVESAWFERGGASGAWGSATADAGWNAAKAAAEPVRDGSTASGLPKRVPKANLVPGSADTAAAPKGATPMPTLSPERVRNRLASFQKGFRAARDEISEGRAAFAAEPRNVENREEGA